MKIGFIGAGKMAQAIIAGLADKSEIFISGRDLAKTRSTSEKLAVSAAENNAELVTRCELIVLAVKPQVLAAVLAEIAPALTIKKTLISIVAGYELPALADLTNRSQPIIRVMPNVNAAIAKSTSAITRNAAVSDETYSSVKEIFAQVGSVHELAEKDFSTFAALAGSGPAFIYLFIDALARAGVLHGLNKNTATRIVAETVAASAENVLKSGNHPQALVDSVASPGGTTIEGIQSLESRGFNAAVMAAITATIEKERKLAGK